MVLEFKAVNGTATVYVQTPVRPHAFALLHQLPTGTATAESKTSPLSEVATPFCSGTSVMERTPDQCHDSRVIPHLPQKDSRLHVDPAEHHYYFWRGPTVFQYLWRWHCKIFFNQTSGTISCHVSRFFKLKHEHFLNPNQVVFLMPHQTQHQHNTVTAK